jgi:hypothetical protein
MVNSTWPGPVGEKLLNLSSGVGPFSFSGQRLPPSTQSPKTGAMLLIGQ